jgi:hypothetical protein
MNVQTRVHTGRQGQRGKLHVSLYVSYLDICMCVCVFVCECICMYLSIYVCMHMHVSEYVC